MGILAFQCGEEVKSADIAIDKQYYADGTLELRRYYLGSVLHRENGPAYESFYATGMPEQREWHKHGQLHRENGPAYESYYPTGQLADAEWYLDGKRHREDGPAVTHYTSDGSLTGDDYYLNGKFLFEHEHHRRILLLKLSTATINNEKVSL